VVAAFTDQTGLGASKAPSADPAFAGPAWQGKGALLEADFMARESGSRVLPSDECAPERNPLPLRSSGRGSSTHRPLAPH
jgi:hypothetical protein